MITVPGLWNCWFLLIVPWFFSCTFPTSREHLVETECNAKSQQKSSFGRPTFCFREVKQGQKVVIPVTSRRLAPQIERQFWVVWVNQRLLFSQANQKKFQEQKVATDKMFEKIDSDEGKSNKPQNQYDMAARVNNMSAACIANSRMALTEPIMSY